MILAVLGFLTSAYLLKDHYATAGEGSACDFTENISCSAVNSSIYSEFLNVPVALFGMIWMLILFLMAWNAYKDSHFHLGNLVVWTVAGTLSLPYFFYGEWVVGALCPFCTVVHIITLVSLGLAIWLFRAEYHWNTKKVMKAFTPWLVWGGILSIVPLLLFNVYGGDDTDYTEFAQCITDKGINMYSSYTCGYCAKTREQFCDAYIYINEIECHPDGEHSQWELCQEKEISGTPTWILEPNDVEEERSAGFLDMEGLAEFSGCDLPVEEEVEA